MCTGSQIFLSNIPCLFVLSRYNFLQHFKAGHETLKIGLISDTHLSHFEQRLERVYEKYFKDVDLIFHAGDIVALEVLEGFGGKEVKAVYGNMDPPSVQKMLPEKLIIDIRGFKIVLIHGWGTPLGIEERIINEIGHHVDCVVYGHTHQGCIKKRDGIMFFNPGSPTDKRFADRNTIGIIDISDKLSGKIIELEQS